MFWGKRSVFAAALLVCVSCIEKNTSTEIVIGEYGALTGPESSFGSNTHRGVQMAVEEANAAGGVRGVKLRLKTYDDQGKTDEAVTAVTRLITQDGAVAIIGEVASTRSLAAGAIAQQYGVPMVSPSSTNPAVTQVGDYIFRVCFIDPFQGEVMAKFARENLKIKTAGIFVDDKSDYSVGLAKFFKKAFEAAGGQVLEELSYVAGDLDFKSQLTAFKRKPIEALFLPGYYNEVGLIARQARELGFKGVFLGGDGWDSETLTQVSNDAIVGGFYSNHFAPDDKSPSVQGFVKRYAARFGGIPNASTALGYDAAAVTIDALKRTKQITREELRARLAETSAYPGVTGLLKFNRDRNVEKPAVVLRVLPGAVFEFMAAIHP